MLQLEDTLELYQGNLMCGLLHKQHPEDIKDINHTTNISTGIDNDEAIPRYILPFYKSNIGKSLISFRGIS